MLYQLSYVGVCREFVALRRPGCGLGLRGLQNLTFHAARRVAPAARRWRTSARSLASRRSSRQGRGSRSSSSSMAKLWWRSSMSIEVPHCLAMALPVLAGAAAGHVAEQLRPRLLVSHPSPYWSETYMASRRGMSGGRCGDALQRDQADALDGQRRERPHGGRRVLLIGCNARQPVRVRRAGAARIRRN